MKSLKSYIFESSNNFDNLLKNLKGKELSFEDFKKKVNDEFGKSTDISDIKFENNKTIDIYYSVDDNNRSITCLSIDLDKNASKDKFKIISWKEEEL